ncbi:hypothetical protein GCM10011380_12010 [Sphingomonas metalli]|uniref:N-acetyltransferase domain-containing protein n=1 Tax=Sphingomonas metalli TaxID=1779358 RepID=A0A916WRL5_9SPHN|nr:N-acetyltransferase [Sphingomonas metalli]GGB23923.1 hypothetical protein GCM10011380_12010 [Sphingomonas metalli]
MTSSAIAIHPAGPSHVAGIDALLRGVFPRGDEADLVRHLCIDGDMVLTLVAAEEDGGAVIGMVAFSRMAVTVGDRPVRAVALAPVAVAAGQRRQGVAEALVQAGLDRLEREGIVLCFVLGEPDYYHRFGFHADYARHFASPYAGDYLMALPLQGGLMPCGVRGEARHAEAFSRLG